MTLSFLAALSSDAILFGQECLADTAAVR